MPDFCTMDKELGFGREYVVALMEEVLGKKYLLLYVVSISLITSYFLILFLSLDSSKASKLYKEYYIEKTIDEFPVGGELR